MSLVDRAPARYALPRCGMAARYSERYSTEKQQEKESTIRSVKRLEKWTSVLSRMSIMNIFRFIAVAFLMLILLAAGLFLFGEWQRASLIEKYSHVGKSIKLPSQAEEWSTSSLLEGAEELVCAMDSYGWPEDLKALNEQQKKTLSKTDIPSESGAWYLLFFTVDQVNRIAMLDYSRHHLNQISTSCGDKSSMFLISTVKGPSGRQRRSFVFNQMSASK